MRGGGWSEFDTIFQHIEVVYLFNRSAIPLGLLETASAVLLLQLSSSVQMLSTRANIFPFGQNRKPKKAIIIIKYVLVVNQVY